VKTLTAVANQVANSAIYSRVASLADRECLTVAKNIADAREPTSTNASALSTELLQYKAALAIF
jgi:hypothetical protein